MQITTNGFEINIVRVPPPSHTTPFGAQHSNRNRTDDQNIISLEDSAAINQMRNNLFRSEIVAMPCRHKNAKRFVWLKSLRYGRLFRSVISFLFSLMYNQCVNGWPPAEGFESRFATQKIVILSLKVVSLFFLYVNGTFRGAR